MHHRQTHRLMIVRSLKLIVNRVYVRNCVIYCMVPYTITKPNDMQICHEYPFFTNHKTNYNSAKTSFAEKPHHRCLTGSNIHP